MGGKDGHAPAVRVFTAGKVVCNERVILTVAGDILRIYNVVVCPGRVHPQCGIFLGGCGCFRLAQKKIEVRVVELHRLAVAVLEGLVSAESPGYVEESVRGKRAVVRGECIALVDVFDCKAASDGQRGDIFEGLLFFQGSSLSAKAGCKERVRRKCARQAFFFLSAGSFLCGDCDMCKCAWDSS